MIDRSKVVAFAAGVALLATAGAASAQNKCQGSKIKGAGKKAACLAGLDAKLVGAGAAIDSAKVAKCQAKVGAAYAKLEGKGGCNSGGDAGTIEGKVDAFIQDVTDELSTGTLPNKCQGAKVKGAGKKAACLAGLAAKLAGAGAAIDSAKVAKCQAKVGAAYAKLEGKGDCNSSGDAGTIEGKVDAFVQDLLDELNVGPTPTTTTTTTAAGPSCCSAVHMETLSSAGTLAVSTLPAFPFPPNVLTVMEVGAADSDCKHTGVVPAGGYYAPVFCIPALGYTSTVIPKGCESGGADGAAVIWDKASTTPDPNVARVGDTSDPSTNSCGTLGAACNTSPGNAGGDTKGNINTTRGGAPLAGGTAMHSLADVPVTSRTWNDVALECPDADGQYDPGNDTLVTQFDFILSQTTGTSTAAFSDLNADSCSRAGNGPNTQNATGSPLAGPCCTVGQAATVVATGIAFSGASPLYDLSFKTITPVTVSVCSAPSSSDTCTLTTDACQD